MLKTRLGTPLYIVLFFGEAFLLWSSSWTMGTTLVRRTLIGRRGWLGRVSSSSKTVFKSLAGGSVVMVIIFPEEKATTWPSGQKANVCVCVWKLWLFHL